METIESIRPLLTRFSENEETVRQLMAKDEAFDALCREYREIFVRIAELDAEIKEIRARKAKLEEELLMHIEGYEPQ